MTTASRGGGLRRRLGRAFLAQAVLISVAAGVGVYAAGITIEKVLIRRALEEEASHFWPRLRARTDFPVPDTRNLTGYLRPPRPRDPPLPARLRGLEPGFHHLASQADFSVVHVSERGGRRLLLVFDGEQVSELATWFGLVPLAAVLVVLYLTAWIGYRLSRRAVSPVEWLAREVHRVDPEAPDAAAFAAENLPGRPEAEVVALADALARLARRINEFVERERNFTRDASHELRSPLTVIRIAADMLLSEQELDRPARNSVVRIKRAATDMEELTHAFLLLARESEEGLETGPVCVNDVAEEEIERARLLVGDKPVTIEGSAECRLVCEAPWQVLSALVGNLVRNAASYTDEGRVRVHVARGRIEIEDSGAGIPDEEVEKVFRPFYRGAGSAGGGHGVGLTIVRRLSDRFAWPLHIESTPGVGTRVVVEFPESASEEIDAGRSL